MLAAKNKYNAMVEEGTWNAPTVEEKIVALEAKLTSSTKTLNKKVSFETSKKGSGKAKSTGDKSNKSDQRMTAKRNTLRPGPKKVAKYSNGYNWYSCSKDTGAGKCENGGRTSQRNAKEKALRNETNPT
jgi:hypothetical protein